MQDKYIACMLLHAVGDTVGYKNSEWEFKRGRYDRTLEKVYEYIELGGVTHISLKDWNVSDDTIMHIQTAASILEDFDNLNALGNIFKKNYLDALNQFEQEGFDLRSPGLTMLASLRRLRDGGLWNELPYDFNTGGAGSSMRTLCIGLAFYGEANRHKLIQISIESSRITHNSTTGYLGGLTSALFTAFAVEKKPIYEWPFALLELFNSSVILKYIKTSERGVDSFLKDSHVFIGKWQRYVDDKFDEEHKPVKRKSDRNLVYRSAYYSETFGYNVPSTNKLPQLNADIQNNDNGGNRFIGSGGDDSVIIAYDCLVDAGNNWEKLVYYSMLHMGDTDTTGCIAGGLFGILHGMDDVPKNFLEHLEYKDVLEKLGKDLHTKFNVNLV